MNERVLRTATVGVALAGVVLTTYLFGVGGTPVAALGLAVYVAIGALALLASPTARAAAIALSLAAMAFSGYLLVVQVAVIGELCQWCFVNDGTVTLLAALIVLGAMPRSRSAPSPVRIARARRERRGAASA